MFTEANGITINSGTYTNVGGAVYNVKGDANSANSQRKFQRFQAGIERNIAQYGGNVDVSAFERLRNTTINGDNASVTNAGGGVYDVDLTQSKEIEEGDEQNRQTDNAAQQTTRVINQTRYNASIFRGAQMGNMKLTGSMVNTAMGDYSGAHGLSPEIIQTIHESTMRSNGMYAGDMTASMFESATSNDTTIGNVRNVAGNSFGGFSSRW